MDGKKSQCVEQMRKVGIKKAKIIKHLLIPKSEPDLYLLDTYLKIISGHMGLNLNTF